MTRPSKLVTAARIILGLIFTLSGLNHLTGLIAMPPMAGDTALFWEGLQQTGYFFPLLGAVEVAAGALLLWGRMVPLALAMVAPIAVNVAAFHLALAPQGLGIAALVLATTVFLAWRHRQAFAPLARAAAGSGAVRAVELALGVALVASGLMGLLGRTPPPSTAGAAAMMKGLEAAGYFMPLLAAALIAVGALLVARRWVGGALVAAAPLVLQILAYRLYVATATPGMLVVGLALVAAQAWLVFAHRDLFAGFTGSSGGRPAMMAVPRATALG
jgi:putative oxidoreductase